MIFVAKGVSSQHYAANTASDKDIFNVKLVFHTRNNIIYPTHFKQLKNKIPEKPVAKVKRDIYVNPAFNSVINGDFYTCNFGFFCKKELQFEKATKIPLRFRLGSLQYNDYLEGKPNAINPF
ncbi:MAG: hypothetical protein WAT20_09315 [Ferruginibacter sp.]|nr:hypothetical protein [Chitinophagaceae bacterium]